MTDEEFMEGARMAYQNIVKRRKSKDREPFIYYALPKEYKWLKNAGADMTNIRMMQPLKTTK